MSEETTYPEVARLNALWGSKKASSLSPMSVSELTGRGPFDGPFLSKDELVDKCFILLEARSVPSKIDKSEVFYHCQCVWDEGGEPFHTSLSGVVINEIIEQWIKEAGDRPLRVKLLKSVAASGMGYYDLE